MDPKEDPRVLWHQSGVNGKGEPFVQLILNGKIIGQLSPEEARDHARAITEAAEASEQDAFMLAFLQAKVGLDRNRAGMVLMDFRAWRVEQTGKKSGASSPTDWLKPDPPPNPGSSVP